MGRGPSRRSPGALERRDRTAGGEAPRPAGPGSGVVAPAADVGSNLLVVAGLGAGRLPRRLPEGRTRPGWHLRPDVVEPGPRSPGRILRTVATGARQRRAATSRF